jgi:hypothetical protein
MADKPVTFDESTARRLIGLLRERRSDPAPLRQEVQPVLAATRRHRWAKATTNYQHPNYPTSGNVVLVEFGEYVFTAPTQTGQTVTPVWTPYGTNPYDDNSFALAVVPTGGTLPTEGDVVRVELDDGIWWIRPSGGATRPVVTLNLAGYATQAGGVNFNLYYGNPSSWYVDSYFGDATDVGLSINTSLSAWDDWQFSLSQGGSYLWSLTWGGYQSTYTGPGYKTYTTSAPSAGAAHTHTVDIDDRYTMFAQTWLERQAGGSGAWDYGVSSYTANGSIERWLGKTFHYPNTSSYAQSNSANAGECGVFCDPDITADDRFRLTSHAWPDNWLKADVGDDGIKVSITEMGLQLTIVRLDDTETVETPYAP